MRSTSRLKKLLSFSLLLIAMLLAAHVVWQRERSSELLTLREALWVVERDYSRRYPPGSAESRAVADALANQGIAVDQRKYSGPVYYREGLNEADSPKEPLLMLLDK